MGGLGAGGLVSRGGSRGPAVHCDSGGGIAPHVGMILKADGARASQSMWVVCGCGGGGGGRKRGRTSVCPRCDPHSTFDEVSTRVGPGILSDCVAYLIGLQGVCDGSCDVVH